jgi:hypothetical protein
MMDSPNENGMCEDACGCVRMERSTRAQFWKQNWLGFGCAARQAKGQSGGHFGNQVSDFSNSVVSATSVAPVSRG